MNNEEYVRIGMLNVRGISHAAQEVEALIEEDAINVMALPELKLMPGRHIGLSMEHAYVSGPTRTTRTLGQGGSFSTGGVGIVVYGMARHKEVLRIRTDEIQAIGIKIGDVNYVAIYITPQTKKELIREALTRIHRECSGKVVVFGDLNARRIEWCTTNNAAGNTIFNWCHENGWHIDPPTIHTREGPTGNRTTIDIAITRNCQVKDYKHATEFGYGLSDHVPVYANLDKKKIRGKEPARITMKQRTKPKLVEKTLERLERELPDLIQKLETITTQEQLDALYRRFREILTDYFKPKGRKKNRLRYKYFWTDELNRKAKVRSKLYRRQSITRDEADIAIFRKYARQLSKQIKREKRRAFREFIEAVEDDLGNNAPSIVSKRYKNRLKRTIRTSTETSGDLDLNTFTDYVAKKFPASPVIVGRKFEVDEQELQADILKSILHSGRKKAAGKDEIFNEIMRADAPNIALFLTKLWKRCGQTALTPTLWDEVILVPIFKKGNRRLPKNYRGISLMSHPRKIIEKAADYKLRREIEFAISQCGFKPRTGTENALLRFIYATGTGHNFNAVLDIKGAFPSVRRDSLMKEVEKRLSPNMANMISHFLKPTKIMTAGDTTNTVALLLTGVPEGGAISPALFNLYIDTLPVRIIELGNGSCIIIYAGDIILLARSLDELQQLLDVCTSWANEKKIVFGTEKCFVQFKGRSKRRMKLQGAKLVRKKFTEYLGTQVTCFGIHANTIWNRRSLMDIRSKELVSMGFHYDIHTALSRKIFKILLAPVLDYAIHLTPIEGEEAKRAIKAVEASEFRALRSPRTLNSQRSRNRMFNIYNLWDIHTRRHQAASKLYTRLRESRQLAREDGKVEEEEMLRKRK